MGKKEKSHTKVLGAFEKCSLETDLVKRKRTSRAERSVRNGKRDSKTSCMDATS